MAKVDETRNWVILIVWLTLAGMSVPILLDYMRHVVQHSWTWYVLAFFPLSVFMAVVAPPKRSRPVAAVLLVSVGAAIQVWAIASGTLRLGRIGLALAVAGALLLQGRASLRSSMLLALCVPIPHFVLEKLADPILPRVCRGLVEFSNAIGTPAFARDRIIEWPSGPFQLNETDLGLTTAALSFGLGWFLSVRASLPLRSAFAISASLALVGAITHVLVTAIAFSVVEPAEIPDYRTLRNVIAFGLASSAAIVGHAWALRAH